MTDWPSAKECDTERYGRFCRAMLEQGVYLAPSHAILNVFGEKFRLPPEATYEYAVATVDVEKQELSVDIAGTTIDRFDYRLR